MKNFLFTKHLFDNITRQNITKKYKHAYKIHNIDQNGMRFDVSLSCRRIITQNYLEKSSSIWHPIYQGALIHRFQNSGFEGYIFQKA